MKKKPKSPDDVPPFLEEYRRRGEALRRSMEQPPAEMVVTSYFEPDIEEYRAGYRELISEAVRDAMLPAKTQPADLPPDGTKFKPEDVPAEYRDGGKPDGEILTVKYLENTSKWDLKGPYLSRNYGPDKTLTSRIRVGKSYAYRHKEVAALRDIKTDYEAKREDTKAPATEAEREEK